MFDPRKPLFGASNSGFSFNSSPFGSTNSSAQSSTSLFGQSAVTSAPQNSMFANSVFGQQTAGAPQGTSIKFNPPIASDTILRSGQKINVNTKHMCITAMKEYLDKTPEELRLEDYALNRKGSAAKPLSFISPGMGTTNLFGATTSTVQPNSFFGGAASSATPSLTGLQQTQPMNSFGQTAQNSLFGNKLLFGSSTTTPATQPQPGLTFGQSNQNSLFGNKPTFGATTTSFFTGTSAFGAQPSAQTASSGFPLVSQPATNLFGSNSTTSTMFGSTPFGAATTTQSAGLFGPAKPTNSLFATAVTTTSSAFGTSSPFAAKPATGIFGNTLNNPLALKTPRFGLNSTPGFGTTLASSSATSEFGAFGTKRSLFDTATPLTGAVTTTNIFGGGFGSTQPAAQTAGLFGTQPAGFAQNTTSNIFSSGAKQPTPVFGQSLFNTSQSTNLFNSQPNASSNLLSFGATPGVQGFPSFGSGATAVTTAALNPLIEQVTQNARAQQHVLDLVRNMPYGQSSLFRHMGSNEISTNSPSLNNAATSKSVGGSAAVLSGQAVTNTLAEMHKAAGLTVGGIPAARITPSRTRRPVQQMMPLNRNKLFAGFREDDALVSAQSPAPGEVLTCSSPGGDRFFVRREAWKRLNIPVNMRKSTIERSSAVLTELNNSQAQPEEPLEEETVKVCPDAKKTTNNTRVQFLDSTTIATPCQNQRIVSTNKEQQTRIKSLPISPPSNDTQAENFGNPELDSTAWSLSVPELTVLAEGDNDNGNPDDNDEEEERELEQQTSVAGIRLNKPGYYIFPTQEELKDLVDENGRCIVQDFVIGRQSYGHILFPGLTDITGIDFNEVVHIRRREVVVYPDDTKKPPIGFGLNCKAEVTLDGIWPTDKSTREFIKSPQRLAAIRFDERLEKATQKMDAKFIEYRPDTGSWVFEVKHFSKYRLDDSDTESESVELPDSHPPHEPPTGLPLNSSTYNTLEKKLALYDEADGKDQEDQDGFSTNTSTWTTQDYSNQKFQNVKNSLFLDEFYNLNEDMEENEGERETGFVTAAVGRPFQRRLANMKGNEWRSPLPLPMGYTATLEVSSKNLSPETYLWKSSQFPVATIELPSMKTEPMQAINNPMQSATDMQQILATTDDSSAYTFPYQKLTAFVNSGDQGRLKGLFHDSALARGDGFAVSFSVFRNLSTCRHEPVMISRRQLHSANLVKGFNDSDSEDCSDDEEEETQTASLFISNFTSTLTNSNEEVYLNAALQTSTNDLTITPDLDWETSCPQFLPRNSLDVLDSYLAFTEPDANSQSALHRALTMCQALWGRHSVDPTTGKEAEFGLNKTPSVNSKLLDGETVDNEDGKKEGDIRQQRETNAFTEVGLENLARKQAVSEWIRAQLRPWLEVRLKELGLFACCSSEPIQSSTSTSLGAGELSEGILACLLCGELGLACRLATIGHLPSLASLLGGAAFSDVICRWKVQRQLQAWHELKIDQRMPLPILRCYALLAGELNLPHPTVPCQLLKTLEGANYLQALGAHIWYLHSDYSTDLASDVENYSRNWHAFPSTAVAAPCPPYPFVELLLSPPTQLAIPRVEPPQSGLSQTEALKCREWPRDVAYHLLQLKFHQWHSLERTLDPRCFRRVSPQMVDVNSTGLHRDWASAWHLWRVLHSLGYRHLNPVACARLHTEFADAVEGAGLWEWAIFVLLHHSDPVVRAASVKRLLVRHVTLSPSREAFRLDEPMQFSTPELFVVEKLGVPQRWLHEAKACLARSHLVRVSFSVVSRKFHHRLASLEAAHWLAAGHVDAAHEVCMLHLLPDMILYSPSAGAATATSTLDRRCRFNGQLASRLLATLQPFINLPVEKQPSTFDTGAGVYFAYAKVLFLANQMFSMNQTGYCEDDDNEGRDQMDLDGQSIRLDSNSLAVILEDLQNAAHLLCDHLQTMPTPSICERVVKSEMAAAAAHLISTFLQSRLTTLPSSASPSSSSSAVEGEAEYLLRQHLVLLSQIGLPGETRLRELESLSTSVIAKCLV